MKWILSKETELGVQYEVFRVEQSVLNDDPEQVFPAKTYASINGLDLIYESPGRLNEKPLVETNVEILSMFEGHLFAQTKCSNPEKYLLIYKDAIYTLESTPQLVFEDETFANARVYKV